MNTEYFGHARKSWPLFLIYLALHWMLLVQCSTSASAAELKLHHVQITSSGSNGMLGMLTLQNGIFQAGDPVSDVNPGYTDALTGNGPVGYVGTYRYFNNGQTVEWQYGDPNHQPQFVLNLIVACPSGANITGHLLVDQFADNGLINVKVDEVSVASYSGSTTGKPDLQFEWGTKSGNPMPNVAGTLHRVKLTWKNLNSLAPVLIALSNGTFVVADPANITGIVTKPWFNLFRYLSAGTAVEWSFGSSTTGIDGEVDLAVKCTSSVLSGTIQVAGSSDASLGVEIDGVSIRSYGITASQTFNWQIPPPPTNFFWRNASSGENNYWQLDRTGNSVSIVNSGQLLKVTDLNWKIVAAADLFHQGTTDIIWRNTATGDIVYWDVKDGDVLGAGYISTVPDQNWKIVGSADLLHQGHVGLVWQNTSSGDIVYWELNGATLIKGDYIKNVSDLNWRITAVTDLFHLGSTDLVWQNTTNGDIVYWTMNGISIASSGYISTVRDRNWKIVGAADLFHQNHTDLIWQNSSSGDVVYWDLSGAAIASSGYLYTVPNLQWNLGAVR